MKPVPVLDPWLGAGLAEVPSLEVGLDWYFELV